MPRSAPVAVQPVFVATCRSAGPLISGAVTSVTVTVWMQVAVLPLASVAVHVTAVVPMGNAVGALLIHVTPVQLSLAVGVPKFTPVAVQPLFIVVCTFAGQVIVGITSSVTVTVWVHVEVFPLASVAVQVTVVLPFGKAVGALLLTVAPVQLSL